MKKLLLFSAAICLAAAANAQTVTTYAGTGEIGYSSGTKAFNEVKFENPYGVAFDSKGDAWVADMYNNLIVMLRPSTATSYRRAGGYTANIPGYSNSGSQYGGLFQFPKGVAIGAGDTIFIADNENHAIRKITPFVSVGGSQSVRTLAGGGAEQGQGGNGASGYLDDKGISARFTTPTGIAISPDKTYMLVADQGNMVIRRIELSGANYGKVTTFAGNQGIGGDDDGTLSSATFNSPEGIFIDGNGDVYVADFNGGVRKISGGMVTTVVNASLVETPTSVVKVGNALYISNLCNIKKKDLTSGALTVFAGSESLCDDGEGIVDEKLFYGVGQLAVSPDGKYLLAADQFNNRIAKVTLDGPSSVSEISNLTTISIYPNPSQNRIKVSGISGNATISLCDMTGRVIQQDITNNASYSMNVSAVSNGVYVLRIASGNKTNSERVVISR